LRNIIISKSRYLVNHTYNPNYNSSRKNSPTFKM